MLSPRLIPFTIVGAGGLVVQLAVLAALASAGWPVGPATAVAVELAVLHNFVWHQRWTWGDRPSDGVRTTVQRLWRFHAANGLVSLAGNVLITTMLVRALDLHPVAANMAAIIACSLVNYAAGDRIVFRTSTVALALLTAAAAPLGADQSVPAIAGWDKHVASVERRFAAPSSSFFAMDARKVDGWRARARNGEVVMTEIDPPGIDDAKLHHWAGAIYVPHTTVDRVVNRLLESAGRESEFYQEVKGSKLLGRDGDRVRVYLRLFRDAGPVEATYHSEHAVEYQRLGTRAASRSVSTKIAELEHAGTPQEREKAAGDESGFLWRLNAYWRYEQFGDGVLIECESVSLSRSVPFLIRPIANPIVDRIARESLRNTLSSLRGFLADKR